MMPVVEGAPGEGHGVGAVPGGVEHAALLAVPGDTVAFEVGDVGRQRRRAEGPPGLDDDATISAEQRAAAERGAASPQRRAAAPRTSPPSGRRS
jgi:hypothetical protein